MFKKKKNLLVDRRQMSLVKSAWRKKNLRIGQRKIGAAIDVG